MAAGTESVAALNFQIFPPVVSQRLSVDPYTG